MKYHVITIGKIKEKYLTAGIDEFLKRLRPYGQVEVTVLPEEKMPENPSPAQKAQVLDKEGEKMLREALASGVSARARTSSPWMYRGNSYPLKIWQRPLPNWPCTAAVKSPSSSAAPSA